MAILFIDGFSHHQPNKTYQKYTYGTPTIDQQLVDSPRYANTNYQNFSRFPFNSGFGRFQYEYPFGLKSSGFVIFEFDTQLGHSLGGTYGAHSDFFQITGYTPATEVFVREIRLAISPAGAIELRPGPGTSVASAPTTTSADGVLVQGTWCRLSIKIGANTGVEVLKDGVVVLSNPSINTHPSSFSIWQGGWCWQNFGNDGYYLSNFVVLDDTGTENNDYLGPCFISTCLPSGDMGANTWGLSAGVSPYILVSDRRNFPTVFDEWPDGDTTHLFANASANAQFRYPRFFPAGPILAVAVTTSAKGMGVGAYLKNVVYNFSTPYPNDTTYEAFIGDYRYYQSIWERDPVLNATWSEADFVAQLWSFGVQAESPVSQVRITQVALERLHLYTGSVTADYRAF